jgi:Ser/Thr protein kinase RdoA (MazF antagonist)
MVCRGTPPKPKPGCLALSADDCLSRVIDKRDEIARRACAAYGLTMRPGASMTPVARGAMGQIWRLDLGAERYALKELLWGADEESVRREAALTAEFAAAGVRLPGSVPARDGRFLVRLATDLGGRWLRLYQWVDGVPADPADPGVAAGVGDLLGRLHVRAQACAHAYGPPPGGRPDPWYDTVPGPATWDRLARAALRQDAAWGPALASRISRLRELAALVTPVPGDRIIICHRDLHPDNVLVDASGELVLLDWDDIGEACPDRELARLLAEWHVRDGVADAAAVTRTLTAYRAAGGAGLLRDERSFGMLIASRLNFLRAQARVALDPRTTPKNRIYAADEILDTLARLPSPGLIARLLDVAAAAFG